MQTILGQMIDAVGRRVTFTGMPNGDIEVMVAPHSGGKGYIKLITPRQIGEWNHLCELATAWMNDHYGVVNEGFRA